MNIHELNRGSPQASHLIINILHYVIATSLVKAAGDRPKLVTWRFTIGCFHVLLGLSRAGYITVASSTGSGSVIVPNESGPLAVIR